MFHLPAPKVPIATNPILQSLKGMVWVFSVGSVFCLVLGIYTFIDSMPYDTRLPIFASGLSLGFCLLAILSVGLLRRLRRLEYRRFAAVAEGQRDETDVQAFALASDRISPVAVSLRYKRISFIWVGCACLISMLLDLIHFLTEPVSAFHLSQEAFFFAESMLFMLAFIIGISFLSRSTIEVTEKGLRTHAGRGLLSHEQSVGWREARLFACYRRPGLLGSKYVLHYELSSPDTMVSWIRVSNPQSLLSIWKPSLPNEEYQRHMQMLVELVIAKTGLPLYDLSEARAERS